MIDLHVHTRLSIGEYTPTEIIEKFKEKNIDIFSIVDNEHCLAYSDIDMTKYPNLVSGTIFTTSIDGLIINILGYEVNPKIINDYHYEHFGKSNIEKIEYQLFDTLIKIMERNNVKLSENIQLSLVEKGVSKKLVYYDAIKNNPNFKFFTYSDFYRNGLSNPYSEFFLNESELLPSIKDIFDLIKKAGGKIFLAHPYEYNINVDTLIDKLIPLGLDGIEVFHPSAALRQSLKLIDICERNQLLASGGSDFRKSRYQIPIGIHTKKDLCSLSSFSWLRKYLPKENY